MLQYLDISESNAGLPRTKQASGFWILRVAGADEIPRLRLDTQESMRLQGTSMEITIPTIQSPLPSEINQSFA